MAELRALLWEGRRYIGAALILFSLGALLGYMNHEQMTHILTPLLKNLEELVAQIEEMNNPWYMSWIIFQNNLTAALTMLLAGTLIFVIPLFALFANGLAVGYVLALTAQEAGLSPVTMFLFGILPHGVLELPAIFLAGGIGLFLGLRLLRWLFGTGQFFAHLFGGLRHNLHQFWWEETLPVLKRRVKGTVRLVLIVAVMLVGAALLESFLTPLLLYLFVY